MKCIACGRGILDKGTHYECSNILCDYEEDIEHMDVWVRPDLPSIPAKNSVKNFSFDC